MLLSIVCDILPGAETHVIPGRKSFERECFLLLSNDNTRLSVVSELKRGRSWIVIYLLGTVLAVVAHHEGPVVQHRQLQVRHVVVATEREHGRVVARIHWDRQLFRG